MHYRRISMTLGSRIARFNCMNKPSVFSLYAMIKGFIWSVEAMANFRGRKDLRKIWELVKPALIEKRLGPDEWWISPNLVWEISPSPDRSSRRGGAGRWSPRERGFFDRVFTNICFKTNETLSIMNYEFTTWQFTRCDFDRSFQAKEMKGGTLHVLALSQCLSITLDTLGQAKSKPFLSSHSICKMNKVVYTA